jgi:hypothetical protein
LAREPSRKTGIAPSPVASAVPQAARKRTRTSVSWKAPLELGQLRLQPGADLLAEVEHDRVGDPVERPRPLLAAGEEALGVEGGEVLGDVLLGGAQRLGQLADRSLAALAQEIEDAQPGGVREGAETARDQLGGGGVEGALHRHAKLPIHNC